MVKITDILLELFLVLLWILSSILIFACTDYPFLIFIVFIFLVFAKGYIKRQKRILKYVKNDFQKLGYELLDERPLKFSDIQFSIEVKPAVFINGIPLERYGYVRRFSRIFKAKSEDGNLFELNSNVTKKWNGEIEIEIVNKRNIC